MSLFATAIGALVALLPRPVEPVLIPVDSEVERLRCENERLTRSHARLVDHIEMLEREFLTEQHICRHWKEEAERLARQSREAREAREQGELLPATPELDAQYRAQMTGRNAMAYAQAALLQQQAGMQQAQLNQQYAQQNMAVAQQHQLAQYAGLQGQQFAAQAQQAQGLQWRGDYDGFCNCVPSRAQVWGANRGEG